MEAVYKNSKNSTFSSSCHARNNSHDILYTSPFHLSYSSSFSSSPPNFRPHQNKRKISNITNQRSLSVRKPSVSTEGRERFKHQPLNNRLGPDPVDVPKFLFSITSGIRKFDKITNFSGSVVSTVLSPPPSSLPLPTFSLRPKLCCNTVAATGIDAGATDSLRRILRIQ